MVMIFFIIVSCGVPAPPRNGYIETYNSTTVGAQIAFQCNQSYLPLPVVTAICDESGMWMPVPGDLDCVLITGKLYGYCCSGCPALRWSP